MVATSFRSFGFVICGNRGLKPFRLPICSGSLQAKSTSRHKGVRKRMRTQYRIVPFLVAILFALVAVGFIGVAPATAQTTPTAPNGCTWVQVGVGVYVLSCTPADTDPKDIRVADVIVVQRPNPNYGATAGSVVSYDLIVGNLGDGQASDVSVKLTFDPTQIQVIDTTMHLPTTWLSARGTDWVTVNTGVIPPQTTSLVATLRFTVQKGVRVGTSLVKRATFAWNDHGGGGYGTSNLPIVSVAAKRDQRALYAMQAEPSVGTAGTTFAFSSGLLAPKEPVGIWYNDPSGTPVAHATYYADEEGVLKVNFITTGLRPGTYTMVFYGHVSGFTILAPFTIK